MPIIKRQLTSVDFRRVAFEDAFWAPRIETNRAVTLPHIYRQLEETGRIQAFGLNFKRSVPSPIVQIFQDSDTAKWLEAACYSLAANPNPSLAAMVNQVVPKIIAAQQPDGYLNTHFIVAQPEMRWRNLRDWHELYCCGHLIESAVAHHQATGEHNLLDAVCRYADLVDATFGRQEGKLRGYCGHPEIELALVRLYHATGNPRYRNLASYFIDERGQQPHYYDQEARLRGQDPADYRFKTYEYCQAQVPLRQQTKVVGHAVRAMYLLSAAADLAHENQDPTLLDTCERLWQNLVTRRIYLTGGIGPASYNEGFTDDYDLPDESAYAETCATIGLIQWNQRLLQFNGESRYADVIERGLYNGFLSSVSLDGAGFFYENPLASLGGHHRQGWFDCPCCPPNVARTLASLGQYFYSTGANSLWVHLFAQGTVHVQLNGVEVSLRQVTNYPWEGAVKLEVGVPEPLRFTLHLRLPGWCERYQVHLNGAPLEALRPLPGGYLAIERVWQPGDIIQYSMEMPVKAIWAHPAVSALQGRLALQRGPLVYCLEGVDQPGIPLSQVAIDSAQVQSGAFTVEYRPDLLGGVNVIHGEGCIPSADGWEDTLYRTRKPSSKTIQLLAVPYCTWDNRAPGEMRVWLRSI